MEPSIDLRKLADLLFEQAKRYGSENGVLPRGRVLLRASGALTALPMDGEGVTEREHQWEIVRQAAQEFDAVAIFTLRHSSYRCFPHGDPESPGENSVPDGWIADGKLHDCLNLRIEVPGEKAIYLAVPYQRDNRGKIEFGESSEGAEDFIGLAPHTYLTH